MVLKHSFVSTSNCHSYTFLASLLPLRLQVNSRFLREALSDPPDRGSDPSLLCAFVSHIPTQLTLLRKYFLWVCVLCSMISSMRAEATSSVILRRPQHRAHYLALSEVGRPPWITHQPSKEMLSVTWPKRQLLHNLLFIPVKLPTFSTLWSPHTGYLRGKSPYLRLYKLGQCFPNCCLTTCPCRKWYCGNDHICMTQRAASGCQELGPQATVSQSTGTQGSGHPSWEALPHIKRALPWVLLWVCWMFGSIFLQTLVRWVVSWWMNSQCVFR